MHSERVNPQFVDFDVGTKQLLVTPDPSKANQDQQQKIIIRNNRNIVRFLIFHSPTHCYCSWPAKLPSEWCWRGIF